MNKIIRVKVELSEKECNNIEQAFEHFNKNENSQLEKISKKIELKYLKKSNLNLLIYQEDKKICITITYLNKSIFFKECYVRLRDVLGLCVPKEIEGYTFLIDIDRKNNKQNYERNYEEKLSILKENGEMVKLFNGSIYDENIKEIYNRIIYYDFSKEEELLLATYCLFVLLPYNSKYDYIFDLYEQKLNYIGYNIKDFCNKNNKYSLDEIQKINNENNSSKNILNYLIGLVNFIKEDGSILCNANVHNLFYIAIVRDIFLKYFLSKS